MANERLKWKRITKGDELPCQSFLRKKDGDILKLSTVGGVKVGQDAYYLPVDDVINVIKDYPVEESEDERIINNIRKVIGWHRGMFAEKSLMPEQYQEIDAWLEKKGQGEQKPVDKVEPKFHEGEWVVTDKNNIVQIKAIKDSKYVLENTMRFSVDYVDKCWRKWTIQDAKDCDVLAAHECLVLFKEIDGLNIRCYCTYHYLGFNPSFYVDTLQNKLAFQPATKEQRDTLIKAMADAGYEWSDKDRKLIKIVR